MNGVMQLLMQIFFIIGIVGIMISGIFLGVWTDEERSRANFYSETVEYRNFRMKMALYFGMAGLISLGVAVLLYFF